jgi:hypothetical protein
MILEEPDFATERQLEEAVASVAKRSLEQSGADGVVLRGFGLDLAVFLMRAGHSASRFFEVKAFSEHHGRCGFGNQRGEGNQIRLLYDLIRGEQRELSELKLFDPYIRWILGNRSKPVGSARYAFFTCKEAQAAAANGVRPGKQNNFRMATFDRGWITWPQLVQQLTEFVLVAGEETPPYRDMVKDSKTS